MDIVTALADNSYEVTVISPKPTRPLGFKFDTQNNRKYSFKHIVIDSYTYPESKLFGRMKESYSLGKAFAKFIKKNHHSILFIKILGHCFHRHMYIWKHKKRFIRTNTTDRWKQNKSNI